MNAESNSPNTLATAYALGELSDAERAAFEAQMETDPVLASLARDTKNFCSLLDANLRAPVPSLADENRAALLAAGTGKRRSKVIWIPWLAGAAAACVAGGFYMNNQGFVSPSNIGAAPPEFLKGGGHDGGVLIEKRKQQESGHATLISSAQPVTIKPEMPKPLFAGTPLPDNNPPANLDRSGKPVLEVQVPTGVALVSKGKPVTCSDSAPLGELSWVTDGDKNGDDGYFVDILPGLHWVQIDLGVSQEIHLLWMWHYHKVAAIYKDVVVQISDDPDFKAFTTVFNNDWDNSAGFGIGKEPSYIETNHGRAMPVKGVTGRYVRCWSNGRNVDDTNHYIEVEVYGRPPAVNPSLLAEAGGAASEQLSKVNESGIAVPAAENAPARATSLAPAHPADPAGPVSIKPAMPKPLFAGTPLPDNNPPPNLERSAWPAPPPLVASAPPQISAGMGAGGGMGGGRGNGRGAGIGDGFGPGSGPGFVPAPSKSKQLAGLAKTGDFDGESARYYQERRRVLLPAESPVTPGTESYKATPENPFLKVPEAPLSTFSIDVDTASYSNVRRFLNMNQAPPPAAVRLEELVNYFPYDYAPPVDGKPFAVHVELTSAPWDETHRLARIALKGKEIHPAERPAANLVFLVDVSGSMDSPVKLPLVKQSLRFVVERLTEKDTVSLVTYAGQSGVALPATNGADKARIMAAIDGLGAGGSTNGAGGITTAYQQAAIHFNKEGINRVILATDGDFNVGVTSHDALLKMIEEKRKTGVFLSLLGYGMGNTKDDTMELLANKGNGNYAYIDSLSEARKALGEQFSGTLVTIAKDVKIQIEFNPAVIRSYRLLGYENRMLAAKDFKDDTKDAGEIGAGHTVTALYELVPVGAPEPQVADDLRYTPKPAAEPAPPVPAVPAEISGETMIVKLRWKAPDSDVSTPMDVPIKDPGAKIDAASPETKWAVAVAGFAAMLNGSQFNGLTWDGIRTLAKAGKGADPHGYRGEFLQLLDRAESVARR
jgi:secreted protein with Ig-like and vWFA domain